MAYWAYWETQEKNLGNTSFLHGLASQDASMAWFYYTFVANCNGKKGDHGYLCPELDRMHLQKNRNKNGEAVTSFQ